MHAIPVFYDERLVADAESFSPSAGKPRAVVESWRALDPRLAFHSPVPVTRDQLCLAHDADFVDGVLAGRIRNGFGNCLASVAQSLPWTSGAMLAAAREAIANGKVAVAPCSGFHHAGHDSAGGFCTFNGLMVTAQVLLAEGVGKIGILDFDLHYGDGTDDILDRLQLRDRIEHYTAGLDYSVEDQAPSFLARIPLLVQRFTGCDVLLYQAGADPHIDDPMGGWLTDAQLFERDLKVFLACQARGIPIAWNLAGGYQKPLRKVLDIHDCTMRACLEVYLGAAAAGDEFL